MSETIAVILAGGRGERLRPITDYIPKPMLPVGAEEKPVLEYIIEWIKKFDIRNYLLLVGYKYKQVVNYFRDGGRWDISIRYSVDDEKYRGTGGALLKVYKKGLLRGYDYVLLWYGDVIAHVDVNDMINKCGVDEAMVVAVRDYRLPVGILNVNNGIVTEVLEKPLLDRFVGIGVHLFGRSSLRYLDEINVCEFDVGYHLLPFLLNKNIKIRVFHHTGKWMDVGSRFVNLSNQI